MKNEKGLCIYSHISRLRGTFLLAVQQLLQPFITTPPQKTRRYNFRDTPPVQILHTSTVSPSRNPDPSTNSYSCPGPSKQGGWATTKSLTLPGSTQARGHQQKLRSSPDLPKPGGKQKHKPLPGSTRTGGQTQTSTRIYPGRGQTQTSNFTRIHPEISTSTRAPSNKSKNLTLLPHIENLYKGVGGK